ncbi:MAG TPA: Rieske 2Fe-2S domain-containing protein [Chloroflexota bacterium]|nr:Rieske 2Fe-2S domain-containing protein [Chloroflexota bacterium]
MLTAEENELLTRVGPGAPAGELFRRYWLPIAVAQQLSDERPTTFVRVLGEDLVLFRDKRGMVGLIADHCSHRGASMLYGRVEERGIACAYHGWLYDTKGNCLETPAEPSGSMFHLTVKHRAYPVQKFLGLYWAYLGPEPAPLIPPYDIWVRKDGTHRLYVQPQLDCNWLQPMENSVDPSHSRILHADVTARRRGLTIANTTRGKTDEVEYFDFTELPIGIMKKRVSRNGHLDEHPLIFPNILRHGNDTQIRVPIDDTHTWVVFVNFEPSEDGSIVEDGDELPVEYLGPYKEPAAARYPWTRYTMDDVQPQDHMAWESQGPIADRSVERLATSDRGIVMLRQMLRREIEKVQRGEDPIGIVRDPNLHMIDTNHTAQMVEWSEAARRRGHEPYSAPVR